MDPLTITAILTGAISELLGSTATKALTGATKKIVQEFQNRKPQLQIDLEKALPRAVARIKKEYGRQARVLQFLDFIGRHAKCDEARELFNEATNAYLFQNFWSRNHLPALLDKFMQNCVTSLSGYGWPQADEDFAEFFRQLELDLKQSFERIFKP